MLQASKDVGASQALANQQCTNPACMLSGVPANCAMPPQSHWRVDAAMPQQPQHSQQPAMQQPASAAPAPQPSQAPALTGTQPNGGHNTNANSGDAGGSGVGVTDGSNESRQWHMSVPNSTADTNSKTPFNAACANAAAPVAATQVGNGNGSGSGSGSGTQVQRTMPTGQSGVADNAVNGGAVAGEGQECQTAVQSTPSSLEHGSQLPPSKRNRCGALLSDRVLHQCQAPVDAQLHRPFWAMSAVFITTDIDNKRN